MSRSYVTVWLPVEPERRSANRAAAPALPVRGSVERMGLSAVPAPLPADMEHRSVDRERSAGDHASRSADRAPRSVVRERKPVGLVPRSAPRAPRSADLLVRPHRFVPPTLRAIADETDETDEPRHFDRILRPFDAPMAMTSAVARRGARRSVDRRPGRPYHVSMFAPGRVSKLRTASR
jgi:hypothetical protein